MSNLPGHENCDYSSLLTLEINLAVEAIDEWLGKIVPNLPQARRELDSLAGYESYDATSVWLQALTNKVEAAKKTRACMMCELQNRAQSDHEKWTRDNPGWDDPLLRLL